MTLRRPLGLVWLVAAVALAGCAPLSAARQLAAAAPPPIGYAAPRFDRHEEGLPRKELSQASDEEGIRRLITDANNAQAEALAKHDPGLMRAAAVDSYYQELVQTNRGLYGDGVAAIKLL